jgi:hypothetical protein
MKAIECALIYKQLNYNRIRAPTEKENKPLEMLSSCQLSIRLIRMQNLETQDRKMQQQ